ncbi:MAG: MATE family efflux transporter [Candidatus Izemoplasmatales bacterium]|jgi:putative MATE family efflux protein|nr:MATE family efflux transporter [Candidatus Izemoplasmatales bacterium]
MDQKREELLEKFDVKKALIKLSIPATFAMIVTALYNLVDTIFVGRGVSDIAIGALTIANPVQMIVMAFALMIGIGSSSIFSRAFGEGNKDKMRRSVNTAIIMGIVLSVVVAIVGLIFLDEMLYLFGARGQTLEYAHEYLFYILIGLVPFSLSVIFNNLARAEGRAKIAMISMIIGAGVNIILDPIFIFDWGLNLGVRGAAIATIIAKTASFIYVFFASLSSRSHLNIDLKKIYQVDLKMAGEITAIGFPSFVRNALGAVLVILITNLIIGLVPGDESGIYISIFGVINRLLMFLMMPGFGLVQGLQPIVGYNFGAKLYQRLYDVIGYAKNLMIIYFIGVLILAFIFAPQLFMLFSEERNEIFMSVGPQALRYVLLGFLLVGFQIILSSVYQAMGYPVRAFFIAMSRQFILFIPLVFLFTYLWGVSGIWYTFMASDLIAGLISYIVFKFEMKDLKKKIPADINLAV